MHAAWYFCQRYRLFQIIHEYLLHTQGNALVIEKDIRLEIILETTEIQIRRTTGRDRIITDHQL